MNKILTLVNPTYNMEKYLDKCLSSLIVNNTKLQKQLEVLVVIDGATDRSSEIAHGYQRKYPETFVVVDKPNGNYGSCVNRGIQDARGKYIKILDADDYFDTAVFESYLSFLQSIDSDMVVNDFCSVNEDGIVQKTKHYLLGKSGSSFLFDKKIVSKFVKYNLQMHAIAYKTANLRKIDYKQTEGISYTDQEWTFVPLMTVFSISYFSGVLYYYLVGRTGQTMDPSVFNKSTNQNEICILRKLNDYVNSNYENDSAKLFQNIWIHLNLAMVYRWYLVEKHFLPMKSLYDFEEKMFKIYPEGKIKTDEFVLPGTRYHFVKEWRQKKRLSGFFYELIHFYSRVYSKIERLLTHQI